MFVTGPKVVEVSATIELCCVMATSSHPGSDQ